MGIAKDRLAVRRVKQDKCPPVSGAGRGAGHAPWKSRAGRKPAHPRRLTHETDRPTVVAMRARRHAGSPRRRACASTLGAPYGARGNSGPARHPSDGEAHHSFLSPGVIPSGKRKDKLESRRRTFPSTDSRRLTQQDTTRPACATPNPPSPHSRNTRKEQQRIQEYQSRRINQN